MMKRGSIFINMFLVFLILIVLASFSVNAQLISISSPIAYSGVIPGSSLNMSWTSEGVAHYQLWYSTDENLPCGGNNWVLLQTHPYSPTTFSWQAVPNLNTSKLRLRVEGHSSGHATLTDSCVGNITVADVPSAPLQVLVSNVASRSAFVTWQSSAGLLSGYKILLNNITVNITALGMNNATLILSPSATYAVSVESYNGAGSSRSSEVAFSTPYEDAFPVINLSYPLNGSNVTSRSVSFSCNANDDRKVSSVELFLNNSDWSSVNSSSADSSSVVASFSKNLSDGAYVWNCRATDNSSQSSFAQLNFSFVVDATSPVISLLSPANNTPWNTNYEVPFRYSVADFNNISYCSLSVDGVLRSSTLTVSNVSKDSSQVLFANVSNGVHLWNVSCSDKYGNIGSSESRVIFMDVPDQSPRAYPVSPISGLNTSLFDVQIVCGADDDYSLKNITLLLNATSIMVPRETFAVNGIYSNVSFTLSNLSEGWYVWSCSSQDNSTHLSSVAEQRLFRIDRTPPNVVSNIQAISVNSSSISWSWVNPSDLDFSYVSVFVNGLLVANTSSVNYTASALALNSPYTISLQSVDTAGNKNPALINLTTTTVNNGGPSVVVSYPNGGESLENGSAITISWSSFGVSSYELFYSSDNGASWRLIQQRPYASTSFVWSVPQEFTKNGLIRVDGISENAVVAQDQSNAVFTIGPKVVTAIVVPSAPLTETKSLGNFNINDTIVASFSSSAIPVNRIELISKANVSNVRFTVNALPSRPSDISIDASTSVYAYVSLSTTNLESSSFDSAKINFRVPLSWLSSNNVQTQDVVLYRYNNNVWNELNTTVLANSDSNANFQSVTPGFSVFAIGKRFVKNSVEAQPSRFGEAFKQYWLSILIAVAIIGVGIWLYKRVKDNRSNRFAF